MDGSAHADRSEVRHPGSAGAATRPILVAQIREMDAGLHLSAPGAGQAEGEPHRRGRIRGCPRQPWL